MEWQKLFEILLCLLEKLVKNLQYCNLSFLQASMVWYPQE